ncbi:hypothetical protein DB30_05947 [Enhygromyxa salina]|uniref:Uncharacterized protein n=1 Tax=Enhygromyxa salina TaxID=215803 RepID=A0A0C2A6N1_9BACT|nr:hypothetical protein [Enhygromyxa salina]KIG19043.1 hypothetical protein DB30_05947 [Enhygromyxa salina]
MSRAWTLVCRACRADLSVALTEIEIDADPVQVVKGRDMLPRGCMWRARAGFAEFEIAANEILCCSGDLPTAVLGGSTGCCGPDGLDGPNLRCVCGAAFATAFGDCWQPHVVSVSPKRVVCAPATPEVSVHVYPPDSSHPSAWAFAAWLHEVLGTDDWYGLELELLVQAWAGRAPTPVVIVWLDTPRERAAGVPVQELIAAIGRLAGAPISVVTPISDGSSYARQAE